MENRQIFIRNQVAVEGKVHLKSRNTKKVHCGGEKHKSIDGIKLHRIRHIYRSACTN